MHQKPFFNFLVNMKTNNLILEGEQDSQIDKESPHNRIYGLKFCPIENQMYLYNPLSNPIATTTFVADNCQELINLLQRHSRIRIMCWHCPVPDHERGGNNPNSHRESSNKTQTGALDQIIPKNRVEANRRTRRSRSKDIKEYELEEKAKIVKAVMLLTQLGHIDTDKLNTTLAGLENKYPQAHFRFPAAEQVPLILQPGANLIKAQFAVDQLMDIDTSTQQGQKDFNHKRKIWQR